MNLERAAPTLRERQRERRRGTILDAAWALIGEKGFEDTSVEEIAERAEVGVATVYNYFGSKTDLLHALLERYIESEANLGEGVLEYPPEKMVDGLAELFSVYLDGMVSRCSPRLLNEFLAMSMSRQFGYGRDTYTLKTRFLVQCRDLVDHYMRVGQLRDGVTTEEASMACYGAVTMPFALFALGTGIDTDTAKAMIRRNLQLVFEGIGRATPSSDDEA